MITVSGSRRFQVLAEPPEFVEAAQILRTQMRKELEQSLVGPVGSTPRVT